MSPNSAGLLYLVAGVLFILSLRGLSSPSSSRQGNFFGMAGMAIAVAATLASHPPASFFSWTLVIVGLAIGGGARLLGSLLRAQCRHGASPQAADFGWKLG